MSENYIVINGKRTELTEEQLKQLGIEVPKTSPFKREWSEDYYYIDDEGFVRSANETFDNFGADRFNVANYCTDKAIMEQRALHETLSRLLWRYSMEHDGNEKLGIPMVTIDYNGESFNPCLTAAVHVGSVRFFSTATARNAIKEIVEPFIAEHPEFKW